MKAQLEENYLRQALETYHEFLQSAGHYSEWEDGDVIWRLVPAEVASTIRMLQCMDKGMEQNDISIVLLGTDTADGYLAGKILQSFFHFFRFQVEHHIVEGFQMQDLEEFKTKGLATFIRKVKHTLDEKLEPIMFNITGGYKNFIPIVTHIASFFQLDMYYVFEETVVHRDSIVLIPNVPSFNRIIFDGNTQIDQFHVIVDIIDEVSENEYGKMEDVEQDVLERPEMEFHDLGDELPEILTTFIMKFFELENDRVTMTIFGYLYRNLLLHQKEADLADADMEN